LVGQVLVTGVRRGIAEATSYCSIVSITSTNAIGVSIALSEYCTSKYSGSMMSKLFASRLASEDNAVYEIRDGFIETDMTAPSKVKYNALIEGGLTVTKRFGTPDEIALIAVLQAFFPTRPVKPS